MNTEDEVLKNIMINNGLMEEEQFQEVEDEYLRTGKSFATLLVDFGILENDSLLEIIAVHLDSYVVNISELELEKELVNLLSAEQARAYGVIPIKLTDDGTIFLAASNPLNYQISEDLNFVLGKNVKLAVATEKQIEIGLEKYYPSKSLNDILSDLEVDVTENAEFENDVTEISEMASHAPIIRFVDVILYQAIVDKASDIHFEPFENSFRIRYRVDGVLYEMAPPPLNLAIPVISRLKIISGLNIAERRMPQDGRIQIKIKGKNVDLRVSTIPTQYGESVVLRILDKSVVNLDLESLGINSSVLEQVRKLIHLPNGIFIVTGPTGSGKTTTLYSCLKEINKITEKILTAEDPVEYDLEGVIQLPINASIDMTFARALRAFLRQDPDIIMIGEIRDIETAQMAVQASLTGHFVFSTLHTKEAVDAITRLIDMGVEPYLVTSALVGIIAQRLVRKICTSCKTEYAPKEDELQSLGLRKEDLEGKFFYYGKGCTYCNNTGYKGRKAIVELIKITPGMCELRDLCSPSNVLRKKAIEEGMVTIRNDGIMSVLNGETTAEEIFKYT